MFEFRPALTLLLFTLIGGLLPAQDDAETLIAMARKQEAEARGKSQEDRQICLEDALKTYRSVLTRFPADSAVCQRAWYEVGSLERRLGRIDAAREAYESALGKEGPDRIATRALDGLASIHRRQKSLEQAEGCLKRIVADYPSEPRAQAEARLDLMRLYRASKRFREAIQVGEEIIREHPSIWRVNV
ncbi:MAG: tetratricopeptide repeat protein, partial [Planctomycetes bacterium]|nr:tetratricopeptide repeat protein [Planctomycetota bacterium]